MIFSRIRLMILTFSVLLLFLFSIFFYSYWVSLRYQEQIKDQLLERARLITSQYTDYETLRPFMMRRSGEEFNYKIRMISLGFIQGVSYADKFELAALQRLISNKKLKEVYADDYQMGQAVFRYIKPFRQNGAAIGISLTISRELLLKAYRENMHNLFIFSAIIIFSTLSLAWMLLRRLTMMTMALDTKNTELRELQAFKEELTGMLVHDLKNPLTVVISSLSVMKEEVLGHLSDQQKELVTMCRLASDRLLRMITNILDIPKLEEGKLELKRKEIDMDAFLKKIITKHEEIAVREKKSVILAFSFSEPKISADEDILERILDNLISNSLKHTESEKGKVEVSARYDEAAKTVRFSIKDNGEGIPKEYLEKVFDKFVQVSSRKLGTKLDTGLGLTFCKLAVNAHGGKIWVESPPAGRAGPPAIPIGKEGQGAEFIFTIPL